MKENKKKEYRVARIEGKITWQVEELWEGGVVRGPFGSRDTAIQNEEKIAKANGFFDDLVLQETAEEQVSRKERVLRKRKDAFEKDRDGNWHCRLACALEIDNKTIAFQEGMTFTQGSKYMGMDVARWLDENL